jgi:hypothetical protein
MFKASFPRRVATLSAALFLSASVVGAQARGGPRATPTSGPNCTLATFSVAFVNCWNEPISLGGGNAWDGPNGATMAAWLNTNAPAGATWTGVEKVDDASGSGNGTAFDFTRSSAAGTITFTPDLTAGWFAVAFKQATTHVVYTFNSASDVSALTFNLNSVGDPFNALSNVSLWRGKTCDDCGPPDPSVVPEPAALSLLGFGLVGLAAVRRRRRA